MISFKEWCYLLTLEKAAANFTYYFEKLSALLMELHKLFPIYSEYRILYASSDGLQAALCEFFATVVRICKKSILVMQRGGE